MKWVRKNRARGEWHLIVQERHQFVVIRRRRRRDENMGKYRARLYALGWLSGWQTAPTTNGKARYVSPWFDTAEEAMRFMETYTALEGG